LPLTKQVAIDFNTNYTLMAPGTCAGAANCGYINILIDSTSCNLPSMAYNTQAVSSPTSADFSKCTMPTGQHTITLDLNHDDGTPVLSVLNNPITAMVTITTQ
jgi:hypothetical protein